MHAKCDSLCAISVSQMAVSFEANENEKNRPLHSAERSGRLTYKKRSNHSNRPPESFKQTARIVQADRSNHSSRPPDSFRPGGRFASAYRLFRVLTHPQIPRRVIPYFSKAFVVREVDFARFAVTVFGHDSNAQSFGGIRALAVGDATVESRTV